MALLDTIPSIDKQTLLDMPAADCLVVAVNHRSAMRLRQNWIRQLRQSPQQIGFRLPRILPWNLFLDQLRRDVLLDSEQGRACIHLDSFGELLQWRQVVQQAQIESLNRLGMIARLREAARLQFEWHVEVLEHEENPEFNTFRGLLHDYRKRLEQLKACDYSAQMQLLLEACASRNFILEQHICLLGFHELSHFQERLITALQLRQHNISRYDLESRKVAKVDVCRINSASDELRAAVEWAHDRLLENPEVRVAIVDPQLDKNAVQLNRYVSRIFGGDPRSASWKWNLSAVRPLSEWPLVKSALDWLELAGTLVQDLSIRHERLGQVLMRSTRGLLAAEAAEASQLDSDLRRQTLKTAHGRFRNRDTELSAAEIRALLDHYLPEFSVRLGQAVDLLKTAGDRLLTLEKWHALWCRMLEAMGFPGSSRLSSEQFLSCNVFEEALREVAVLSAVMPPASYREALDILLTKCRHKNFQPAPERSARLDILRVLEAEGGSWDEIWMVGMQQEVMPAVPSPNPFLPVPSLRRANAPRSTHNRELQWARQIIDGILHSAPIVRFSWHAFEGETQLSPSSFLNEYTHHAAEPVPLGGMPVQLDTYVDQKGPAIQGELRGGYSFLDTQARCPLWAFGRFRLGLDELPDYAAYPVDHLVYGNAIHGAMEGIWRQLKDQAGLQRAVNEDDLQIVPSAVKQALLDQGVPPHSLLTPVTVEYLSRCIKGLLLKDLERDDFTVLGLEQSLQVKVQGLTLGLRVDRIDQLSTGQRVVIDIKSGAVPKFTDWVRDVPVPLQLPLYAAYDEDLSSLAGVAFASTHRLTPGYVFFGLDQEEAAQGMGSQSNLMPDLLSWHDTVGAWKQAIERLAHEAAQGWASAGYADAKDLEYCTIKPFLRHFEASEEIEQDD